MLGYEEIRDTGSLAGNRDALLARYNEIGAILAAMEIGTLQQAPDGEWYSCYWDESEGRTQCERSAPPTALQLQVLQMPAGERARLQQELTAEAADLVRQIDAITRQMYYGSSDPATTVVRVTSVQTPTGPVQEITRGPATTVPTNGDASRSLWIPGDFEIIPGEDYGGGGGVVDDLPPPGPTTEGPPPNGGYLPDDPVAEAENVAAAAGTGAGLGMLAGAAAIWLLFLAPRKRRNA